MASLFADADNESAEVFIPKSKDNRASTMVADVMMARNENHVADQIYPPPSRGNGSVLNPEEEEKEGVMKIIRANIKRITEEANKIDYDRLKRSQIQHFNQYGCFSC